MNLFQIFSDSVALSHFNLKIQPRIITLNSSWISMPRKLLFPAHCITVLISRTPLFLTIWGVRVCARVCVHIDKHMCMYQIAPSLESVQEGYRGKVRIKWPRVRPDLHLIITV